jgi:hypothetical protein
LMLVTGETQPFMGFDGEAMEAHLCWHADFYCFLCVSQDESTNSLKGIYVSCGGKMLFHHNLHCVYTTANKH